MLSINTNLSSIIAQSSMQSSTVKLNQAVERMSTGFKINHAKDNAANYSISTNMSTQIGAYDVAANNVAMGMDLVTTASDIISTMQDHAKRLQALSTQARNGTYGKQSMAAINSESVAIMAEINRLYNTAEYNGKSLFCNKDFTIAGYLPTAGKNEFIDGYARAYGTRASANTSFEDNTGFIEDATTYSDSYVDGLTSVSEAIASGYMPWGNDYKIADLDDLLALVNFIKNGGDSSKITFILADDIDLRSVENWEPIGISSIKQFKGTFDGNGHKIKNLKIDCTADNQGFFGYVGDTAVIKNIAVEKVNINVGGNHFYVGALAGYLNGGTIENCYATGYIEALSYVGGLVGYGTGNIKNSYADVNIKALYGVGGVIGWTSQAYLQGCYSSGSVTADSYVGGFAGYIDGGISNCASLGKVKGSYGVGGLVGWGNAATISDSYVTADVVGDSYVGGVAGFTNGNIVHTYNKGDVTGRYAAGGILGWGDNNTVTNCYSEGNVEGHSYIGGVVGFTNGNVSSSYATGDIYGDTYVGGAIGRIEANSSDVCVENTFSTGNVNGVEGVGGVVGSLFSEIQKTVTVDKCYATGDIKGNTSVGGIAGSADGSIDGKTKIIDSAVYSKVITGDLDVGSVLGSFNADENNGSPQSLSYLTIDNISSIPENPAVASYYLYDQDAGTSVLDTTIDLSIYNSNIKTVEYKDNTTSLQVGINSKNTSQISFNTNFKIDFTAIEENIASDEAFGAITEFINLLSERSTQLGAVQNRLDSALESIEVNLENLVSSRSTIRDADIAEESSVYIRQQILQQASATLLATANQSPSIALQLI